jgi:hypothetical protein
MQELNEPSIVNHIIDARYNKFLRIQAASLTEILVPPLDVQAVWLADMLNSLEYSQRAATIGEGLQWIPHVVTRCLSAKDEEAARKRCKELWSRFDAEPWDRAPSGLSQHSVLIPASNVIDDRRWLNEVRGGLCFILLIHSLHSGCVVVQEIKLLTSLHRSCIARCLVISVIFISWQRTRSRSSVRRSLPCS